VKKLQLGAVFQCDDCGVQRPLAFFSPIVKLSLATVSGAVDAVCGMFRGRTPVTPLPLNPPLISHRFWDIASEVMVEIAAFT